MSFCKSFNQTTHSNRKCNLGSVEELSGQTRGAIGLSLNFLPAGRQVWLLFLSREKSNKKEPHVSSLLTTIIFKTVP